jgi:hypothetical protein
VLADLKTAGTGASVVSFAPGGGRNRLGSIVSDPRSRRCATPIGSDAWLELLAFGGGEDLGEALA